MYTLEYLDQFTRTVFEKMGCSSEDAKMAADVCLFMSQNFSFLSFPDELVTGTSIMPHKKNPDVFELIRGKCNKLQSLPLQIGVIAGNLTSGYFRDLQIIKEIFFPAFQELKSCIYAAKIMFGFNSFRVSKPSI